MQVSFFLFTLAHISRLIFIKTRKHIMINSLHTFSNSESIRQSQLKQLHFLFQEKVGIMHEESKFNSSHDLVILTEIGRFRTTDDKQF